MLNIKMLKSPHPFAANTYLISSLGEYAIIDPAAPFDQTLCSGTVKYVLLTHAHFDHILEVESWVNATGATVIIHKDEQGALGDSMRNCFKLYNGTDNGYFGPTQSLSDGESIRLGNSEIKILSCPGHTIGGATYICEGNAFVGDTVFAGGGYGRFDLPTGNLVMLRESIQKIINLPDTTVLYPGHGQSTSVKQYKQDIGY